MPARILIGVVLTVAATFVASSLVLPSVAPSTVTAQTGDQEQSIVDQVYCIKASLIEGCAAGEIPDRGGRRQRRTLDR